MWLTETIPLPGKVKRRIHILRTGRERQSRPYQCSLENAEAGTHYEIQISSGGGQFLPVQRGEVTPNQEETIRFNKTGGSDLRILITNGSAEIAEIKLPELRKE